MPEYTRAYVPGGTFFFTVVTHRRRPILTLPAAQTALRAAIKEVRNDRPFTIQSIVLLPDHLHCIWVLPPEDADFSTRWRLIKSRFTRLFLESDGREGSTSFSRQRKGERGIWQRRFWEHSVRDERQLAALCDYILYNPVKHGHVGCPHEWPRSSFHRFVKEGVYDADWQCTCRKGKVSKPMVEVPPAIAGE